MSDVSRISTENMNEHLVTRINAIEDLSGLNTEDQTSFVNALNEVLGKLTIVGSIGSPLSTNDKWVDMGAKIDEIVEELKDNLSNKGIHVQGKVLSELVKMIPDIPEDTEEIRANIMGMLSEAIGAPTTPEDSVNDMCEKIDGITQDFRDKLFEKGVSIEGTEKINELINKVDAVGSEGEEILVPENWETVTILSSSRYGSAATAYNDKIYIIGGLVSDGDTNICYDTINNTWENKENMPTNRYNLESDIIDGKIYCMGGIANGVGTSSKNECYDILSNSWTTEIDIPTAREGLSVVAVEGKIYCMQGYPRDNRNDCYDPVLKTWTQKKSTTLGYSSGTASAIGKYIYYIGGFNSVDTAYNRCYDTTTNSWSDKASLSYTTSSLNSAVMNGKIYTTGGREGNGYSLKTCCYDPSANEWTIKMDMLTSRQSHDAVAIGNNMYVIGGRIDNATDTLNVDKYTRDYTYIGPNATVQALVNTIGEPCTTEDSVYDICDKLEVMKDNLRDSLEEKGVEVTEEDKLNSLIEKVDDILYGNNIGTAVAGDSIALFADFTQYDIWGDVNSTKAKVSFSDFKINGSYRTTVIIPNPSNATYFIYIQVNHIRNGVTIVSHTDQSNNSGGYYRKFQFDINDVQIGDTIQFITYSTSSGSGYTTLAYGITYDISL